MKIKSRKREVFIDFDVRCGSLPVCDVASRGGKGFGEVGDESRKDVSGLVRVRVIPLANKRSGEALYIVKPFAD